MCCGARAPECARLVGGLTGDQRAAERASAGSALGSLTAKSINCLTTAHGDRAHRPTPRGRPTDTGRPAGRRGGVARATRPGRCDPPRDHRPRRRQRLRGELPLRVAEDTVRFGDRARAGAVPGRADQRGRFARHHVEHRGAGRGVHQADDARTGGRRTGPGGHPDGGTSRDRPSRGLGSTGREVPAVPAGHHPQALGQPPRSRRAGAGLPHPLRGRPAELARTGAHRHRTGHQAPEQIERWLVPVLAGAFRGSPNTS